jgi:hypothetical protein
MEQRAQRLRAIVLTVVVVAAAACSSSNGPGGAAVGTAPGTTIGRDGKTYVYWDQDEEQEYLNPPSTAVKVLVPAWDPNGQMCILPDGSGRFVTGYNPTNPDSQGENPGSKLKFKDPPVGEALWNRDGTFSGTTFSVPGAHKNTKQGGASTNNPDASGDIPPDTGSAGNHFNDNGTFTGCAFGRNGNLYASDLGTAQGDFPPPDSGRLIMWFAPDYAAACIVVGPTQGGDGPHHVDGTGGLRNPGTMTTDPDGNVLVPEAGSVDASGNAGHGRVLELDTTTVPQSPAQCPNQLPTTKPTITPFISNDQQPFPLGIASDPTCECYAVSNVIGGSAIAWYDRAGQPLSSRQSVPSGGYNPFGLGFTPDGTLYFIDIHLAQSKSGFGPTDGAGGLYRVRFDDGHTPMPPERIAGGMSFPTSVTTCDGSSQLCPMPAKDNGPPFTVPDKAGQAPASPTPSIG